MPLVLATVVELDAWLGPRTPAEPAPLLRTASRIVAHAVRVAVPLNDDGTVTNAHQRQALSDATCAQVESMLNGGSGAEGTGATEQSVDGVILNTDPVAPEATPSTQIDSEALRILRTAGLVNPVVPTR